MQRKERKEKRFQLERLESRLILAGNVHAAVVNGNLEITGDGAPNGVLVAQVNETTFLVRGLEAGGENTSIDGQARRVFRDVTGDVKINTGGGADRILVGRAANGSVLPKQLIIDSGKGNDRVVCTNVVVKGAVTIQLGQGADLLSLKEFKARQIANLHSGANADRVLLNSTLFNSLISIRTGDGTDKLIIGSSRADQVVVQLGGKSDWMSVDGTSVRYAYIHGGDGRDALRATRSESELESDIQSIEEFYGV